MICRSKSQNAKSQNESQNENKVEIVKKISDKIDKILRTKRHTMPEISFDFPWLQPSG